MTTPSGQRLHITLFGRRNSGKSSLINALTGQDVALVSDVPGTTTDPVSKAIELSLLGPCLITDTAGYDDEGTLGSARVERTLRALEHTDIAILVLESRAVHEDLDLEREWIIRLKERPVPTLVVISKSDQTSDVESLQEQVRASLALSTLPRAISSTARIGLEALLPALIRMLPEDYAQQTITRGLVSAREVAVLVMPQDSSAPKGRLILPQVQTIRELLDKECITVCCTPSTLADTLTHLASPPRLIITDSQAFAEVYPLKPAETLLTSFSVLMAGYKGDLETFVSGARAIDSLTEHSRVLIAEACTHAPASEDIGRVKIPALLRKKYGAGLEVEVYAGTDYPEDLTRYDLIIHCGGCMINRAAVLSRLARARAAGIPITNYGICMAHLTGILDKIAY